MIPLDECEDRRLYEIVSRNLTVGVFRAESRGFLGIREKLGSRYVFEEYHHDADPRLGTVQPQRALDELLPDDIALSEFLTGPNGERLQCAICGRWSVQYRGNSWPDQPPGPPFYRHADEPDGYDVCREDGAEYGRAYLASNVALYEWLLARTDWARES